MGGSYDEDGPDDHGDLVTDDDYLRYVQRCHDDWYEIRYPYEPTWYVDIAHYLGLQWHSWYEAARNIRQTPAPSYRVRMVINKIQPTIKTLMGKFLRGVPRLICSPTDTTDEAKGEARVGQRLLRALWDHCGMFTVEQDVLIWALTCGTGFFKVGWDPTLGEHVMDTEGRPMYTGDMAVDAIGPFAIFTPGNIKDPRKPCKILEASVHPLDQVKMQFPETGAKLRPDNDIYHSSLYEQRLAALTSPLGFVQSRAGTIPQRSVYKLELWEDPQTLTERERDQFPRGRLTVVANKQLLYAGPNPFSDGKHPYVRARGGVFPGRFWGTNVVDNLIPIQKAINKSRSQMMEARNLTTAPQVVAPLGHGCAKQTNEPGSWLEYKPGLGGKPEYLTPPSINQWAVDDVNRLNSEFEDVAQVREVSKGGLPAANLTGIAINLLQEADNTPWGPVAAEFAEALGEVGQKMLARAYQGYLEPRMFTALDELDEEDVLEFYSSGDQAPVKVRCDVTSVMPESTAARMARVEELIKTGVLHPQINRSTILRLMEFGQIEELWTTEEADARRARRENKRMNKGVPAQIAMFDDDEIHAKEHGDEMKTADFEALPPQIQQLFIQHYQAHLMRIAQLKAEMAPSAPGAGAPSGPSGSPPAGAGQTGAPSPGGGIGGGVLRG